MAPNHSVPLGWANCQRHTPVVADRKMVKIAGEHFVCSELARHGWAAALTRDGLARIDVLAVDTLKPKRRMVQIQVTAASGESDKTSWMINSRAQELVPRVGGAASCRSSSRCVPLSNGSLPVAQPSDSFFGPRGGIVTTATGTPPTGMSWCETSAFPGTYATVSGTPL
jgi:hypothetical protein